MLETRFLHHKTSAKAFKLLFTPNYRPLVSLGDEEKGSLTYSPEKECRGASSNGRFRKTDSESDHSWVHRDRNVSDRIIKAGTPCTRQNIGHSDVNGTRFGINGPFIRPEQASGKSPSQAITTLRSTEFSLAGWVLPNRPFCFRKRNFLTLSTQGIYETNNGRQAWPSVETRFGKAIGKNPTRLDPRTTRSDLQSQKSVSLSEFEQHRPLSARNGIRGCIEERESRLINYRRVCIAPFGKVFTVCDGPHMFLSIFSKSIAFVKFNKYFPDALLVPTLNPNQTTKEDFPPR
jgi:hypothetical protein